MLAATLLAAAVGLVLRGPARLTSPVASPRVPRGVVLAEPALRDFAVSGGPQIVNASAADPLAAKPVLLFLPGIELTGYSVHRQIDALAADYEFRNLAVGVDDRTDFAGLTRLVVETIQAEHRVSGRPTYLVGESFGGVLALSVALDADGKPPLGLAGLVLINPATSVLRSWPAQLPAVLDAIGSLPVGASEAAYQAIATPIFAGISGDPLQLGGRAADESLPPPLRVGAAAGRLLQQLPLIGELPSALPLRTLTYRLSMLLSAAEHVATLPLASLKLPVEVIASTEDRVLPSVEEGRRLVRKLPNAQLTTLVGSGHVPLLEAQVRLAELMREARLEARMQLPRKKDYVAEYVPPTREGFDNASASLAPVRKLTSPVFFSTDATSGARVAGLGALPSLDSSPLGKLINRDEDNGEECADGAHDADDASPAASRSSSRAPVLFVGNHQLYGFLDLPLLVEEIYRQTGYLVRALAHPVAFRSNATTRQVNGVSATSSSARSGGGGAGGPFVDFETFGAVPVNPRALFKLLSRGEPTLLYPGGVREAFKSTKRGEAYKIFWPPASEGSDFARVAAKFGATIVPVAAIGAEEGFEMLLDADDVLALPYLGSRVAESASNTPEGRPGERFVTPISVPKLPGRYYFLFGAPIETSHVDPNDKEACAALYASVQAELEESVRYLLDKRQTDPYEAALPRLPIEASWNWTRQVPTFQL